MAAARASSDPHERHSDASAAARAAAAGAATPGVDVGIVAPIAGGSGARRAGAGGADPRPVDRERGPPAASRVRSRSGRKRNGAVLPRWTTTGRGSRRGDGRPSLSPAIGAPLAARTGSVGTGTVATTGAGLGLALARRLARTAGGDVHAEPAPGRRAVRSATSRRLSVVRARAARRRTCRRTTPRPGPEAHRARRSGSRSSYRPSSPCCRRRCGRSTDDSWPRRSGRGSRLPIRARCPSASRG